MPTIVLPGADRTLLRYTTRAPTAFAPARPPFSRVALAAAHVVADPLADGDPWHMAAIDWDRTLDYRVYLWSLGLGVAEATGAAQRGTRLDWPTSLELIRRSLGAAPPGAVIACGAGTEMLEPGARLAAIIAAYETQCAAIERLGGRVILMGSRALATSARGPADYAHVYGQVLGQLASPAILQWPGELVDPDLRGYWGTPDREAAMETCLAVVTAHAAKVDGVAFGLLDPKLEIELRRRLPRGVRMYTGDEFGFPELIAGDDDGFSHALLGLLDSIAPAGAAALGRLQQNDLAGFQAILAPTIPLARHVFASPCRFAPTGITFMAYLNGHQDHFTMIGGEQTARTLLHLCELFRLADQANLLRDPDDACRRMGRVLAVYGVH